ncbi:MAG: Bax inhibitor-1/YccA family membrane protein [Iamia sp.]
MTNPLMRADKFAPTSGPPTAWPGGAGPGAPVPPAADNVPGGPWPPPTAEPTLRKGGVASATAVLLAIICATGVIGWNAVSTTTANVVNDSGQAAEQTDISIPPWIIIAVFVGLGLALLTFFKPTWARVTAPLYAVAEGVFLGAISKAYETQYEGIVLQAVGLTIAVFAMMLVLYATGRIRVTPRFRLGVIAATGGIFLVYMVSFVVSLFGGNVPFIHDSGPIGIGFSLFVVVIAALMLTLDFDFIDRAEQAGAPQHMEWFAALSLVVTLVWLYLEMLRLLSKIRR